MEENKSKKEVSKLKRIGMLEKRFIDEIKTGLEVVVDAEWTFIGDFETVLQNGNGNRRGTETGQEQSETRVALLVGQTFHQFFQFV